jgi:hypothetical protein
MIESVLTSIVLPLPGGPNNKRPLIGALRPVNSLRIEKNVKKTLLNQ